MYLKIYPLFMKTLSKLFAVLSMTLALADWAGAVQVTFQVNMSAQIGLGNFDPANDSIVVAGDPINGWSTSASPLSSSVANSNIWVGTFDVTGTPGALAQYKFVMNTAAGTVWEGQVGSGGGTGNRTFTITATNEVLPAV